MPADLRGQFRKSAEDELRRAMDPRAHAVTVISEEHRLTHDGMVFYFQRSETGVPDGAFRRTLFRTGAIPPHFKRVKVTASEGPVIVELYENAVVDVLGPQVAVLNANRLSPRTPLTTVFSDTTFTNDGDPLLGSLYIPASGNQGVEGGTDAIEELVLMPNTDYQFALQNDPAGAGTADIVAQLIFYEIDYPVDGTELDDGHA